MHHRPHDTDYGTLVDILSNAAGMMVLLACIALLTQRVGVSETGEQRPRAKPISFPLTYIPDKRPITLCLKNGHLYEMPDKAAMEEAIAEINRRGGPIETIDVSSPDVDATIRATDTMTGYEFIFNMRPDGGFPLNGPPDALKARLNAVLATYPPSEYFIRLYVWQDSFGYLATIREYLLAQGTEVGWSLWWAAPGMSRDDVHHAIGIYDERFSSLKAQ